jgi:hypothetical protein
MSAWTSLTVRRGANSNSTVSSLSQSFAIDRCCGAPDHFWFASG